MTSGKKFPSIEELEKLVLKHGGNTVKNPGQTTFAVIVGDLSFRVKTIIHSNKYNIVSIDWLLRVLGGGRLEFTPHDMIASKPELLEEFRNRSDEFRDRFDEFGDSYTEPIDEQRLKAVMIKMTDLLPYQIWKTEMHKLENLLKFNFNFFRLVFGYFFNEESFIGQMALRLRGGSVVESIEQSYQITHIFVNLENFDKKKLNEFVIQLNLTNVKKISINWILKSNEINTLCEEDEYLIHL